MRRLLPGQVSGSKGKWALFGITEIPDHDDPNKVYLWRLRLIKTPYFGIKVHNIRMSDNPETCGLHDHPWSFISIQLRGGYDELRPGVNFDRSPVPRWSAVTGVSYGIYRLRLHRFVNVVRSTDMHAVRIDRWPCWTLVLNGRRKREWGFRFPGQPWKPLENKP